MKRLIQLLLVFMLVASYSTTLSQSVYNIYSVKVKIDGVEEDWEKTRGVVRMEDNEVRLIAGDVDFKVYTIGSYTKDRDYDTSAREYYTASTWNGLDEDGTELVLVLKHFDSGTSQVIFFYSKWNFIIVQLKE